MRTDCSVRCGFCRAAGFRLKKSYAFEYYNVKNSNCSYFYLEATVQSIKLIDFIDLF